MTAQRVEVRVATQQEWRVDKDVRLAALTEAPYAFGSTFARDSSMKADRWRSWIGTTKTRDDHVIYLAHADERAVGMVGAFHETKTSVMLIAMWVGPEGRRTGIGRRLTQAILDWAAGVKARRVTLWVADRNPDAIALYVAMGFAPTGRHQPLQSAPDRQISEFARKPR